jgi:hypothetical protein
MLVMLSLPSAALGGLAEARAASCAIPGRADASFGEATPASAPAGAGPGVIQIEGAATPAATPMSLPAATPASAPAATPDPQAVLATELANVSVALAACLSAGDAEMVVQLAGERYLGQLFGSSVPLSRQEYLTVAAGLSPTPTRIVGVDDVTQAAPDRATATVTPVVGHQLTRGEWTFEPAPRGERSARQSAWRVASERPLPVSAPAGAAAIAVTIGDRSFSLDPPTVDGPDVVLHGTNTVAEDHEMLVLRLAPGYTTADLLRAAGPNLPDQVTYIGEMPVRAGAEGDLVLVDLAPGDYTIVCLLPDAEGTPHLADGMEATFTVG